MTKSRKIILSVILPRTGAWTSFFNKIFNTNSRLETLCLEEGVHFVSLWDNFYGKSFLFNEDGLHLNPAGSARFGRLLSEKVANIRKNVRRLSTEVT